MVLDLGIKVEAHMVIILGGSLIIAAVLAWSGLTGLARADDPDYDMPLGYDKPIGWIVTLAGVVAALAVFGLGGCGPLAGLATLAR